MCIRDRLLTEQLEGTRIELRARRLKALKIRMDEEEAAKNGGGGAAAGSRRQSTQQQRRSSFLYLGNNVFSDSADEEDDDDDIGIDDVPDAAALEARNRDFYWNETCLLYTSPSPRDS
eukprot:TRINITY_DN22439_c0_g1_i1.p1 TRINITY_DN22439_c0_g1~~TRINITY_DN22439_c0_g1_i1.p1  ORF type:complete len:118 (-),score=43.73 TRINITY_DN22439_c0_g1_i1:104-457(-)